MAHRGEKGTEDNVKQELLITNYNINPVTPIEIGLLERATSLPYNLPQLRFPKLVVNNSF
mgnify:CR=1 FL=1